MKTLLIAILVIISFSCSKDNDDNQNNVIYTAPGLYMGTYTVDQVPAQGSLFYSFIIQPDATMVTEGRGGNGATYYSAGTWTLTQDTLRCTFSTINFPSVTVTQSAKFYFNKNDGSLTSGTWKDVTNGTNSGTYIMTRVQ
jgi:hypothetical protein